MPDKPNNIASHESTLAVPGVVSVTPGPAGQKLVLLGPAAGWIPRAGIKTWERELSFVSREDLTAAFARSLHATMPHEQIAKARFPLAYKAAETSPLLGITGNLVDAARKEGICVHTVGADRVSGDFFYFAEGGTREPVSVQGNLVEMLGPSIDASSTNADIEVLLDGLIDRLLSTLSGGMVSELRVELADALPRLSRDGTGLEGTNLEAFEQHAVAATRSAGTLEEGARGLAKTLEAASKSEQSKAAVPLYGEAQVAPEASLEVLVSGATMRLPPRRRWLVSGDARATVVAKAEAAKKEAPAKPREEPRAARSDEARARTPSTTNEARPKTVSTTNEARPKTASVTNEVRARTPSTTDEVRPKTASVTNEVRARTPSTTNEARPKAVSTTNEVKPAPAVEKAATEAPAAAAAPASDQVIPTPVQIVSDAPSPPPAEPEAAAASAPEAAAAADAAPAEAAAPADAPAPQDEGAAPPYTGSGFPPPAAAPARRPKERARARARTRQAALTRAEAPGKNSPLVLVFLLLAFVATLYLSVRAFTAR